MSKKRILIQVFEHQKLRVGEPESFSLAHFKALEQYAYRNKEKYFVVGNQRLKFGSYVGVIQVKNLTIEVLPKADRAESGIAAKRKWHSALIAMLKECKSLKLDLIHNTHLKLGSATILDLYFDAYLTETENLFRHGLKKSYRKFAENLGKVKGKVIFSKHIQKNLLHKERFFVEHCIYDKSNLLNQILLKALLILAKISNNPNFISRIKLLLLGFEGIEERKISQQDFLCIRFNRNTDRYRSAIKLARLIILNYSPDLQGGSEDVLAIMFDMNRLYENYIYRKLKILEKDPEIPIVKVSEQNKVPFWANRGLRADIVIEGQDRNLVIDTKWKMPENGKPSDGDLKQMFVYKLHYDSCLSILLYPKTTLGTFEKKPYKNEAFENLHCQVAFVDLFLSNGFLNRKLGYKIFEELLEGEISPIN